MDKSLTPLFQRVQETSGLCDSLPATPVNDIPMQQHQDKHLRDSPQRCHAVPAQSSPSQERQNANSHVAASALQHDEVEGFLMARVLPEAELRLASRFQDDDCDVSFFNCLWSNAFVHSDTSDRTA